jgi:CheY-like chemotaxis protein
MKKPSILILEDDHEWIDQYTEYLAQEYEIFPAQTVEQAWEILKYHKVCLSLVDIRLVENIEDEQGMWFIEALRRSEQFRTLPIIVITAFGKEDEPDQFRRVRKAFRDLHVFDYLRKVEVTCRLLQKKVRQAISEAPIPNTQEYPALIVQYSHTQKLLSASVLDEKGCVVFNETSSKQADLDAHSFTSRADEARRSDRWRTLIKDIGHDLYERMFEQHPAILRAYNHARGVVRFKDASLILIFDIQRNSMGLPLELLHDGQDYLSLRHPMSRRMQGAPHPHTLLNARISNHRLLRLLLVASNTGNIPAVDREISDLSTEIPRLLTNQGIQSEIMQLSTHNASYENIRREIERDSYDVWHYAGHGMYDSNSPEQSALYFWEQRQGEGKVISLKAEQLRRILSALNTGIGLVYLSCCQGSATGGEESLYNDDFLGITDALIMSGIPAVIGFRWSVNDQSAFSMAKTFYSFLAEGFDPRRAFWKTRCEFDRDDPTWAAPILTLQS